MKPRRWGLNVRDAPTIRWTRLLAVVLGCVMVHSGGTVHIWPAFVRLFREGVSYWEYEAYVVFVATATLWPVIVALGCLLVVLYLEAGRRVALLGAYLGIGALLLGMSGFLEWSIHHQGEFIEALFSSPQDVKFVDQPHGLIGILLVIAALHLRGSRDACRILESEYQERVEEWRGCNREEPK